MTSGTDKVKAHFDGKAAVVRDIYCRILEAVSAFGTFEEDPKKTSIHLNRRTAFAGIATRKDSLLLTIKASADIPSPRIRSTSGRRRTDGIWRFSSPHPRTLTKS